MRWWHLPQVHELELQLVPDDPWTVEQFWQELAQPTRGYLVAVCDGRVVGYAGVFMLPPDGDIQTIGVDPSMQGRGIAHLLLSSQLAQLDASGVTHTMLEVRAGNGAAVRLYEGMGFETISRRPRYYPDGEDALVMRRARGGHHE